MVSLRRNPASRRSLKRLKLELQWIATSGIAVTVTRNWTMPSRRAAGVPKSGRQDGYWTFSAGRQNARVAAIHCGTGTCGNPRFAVHWAPLVEMTGGRFGSTCRSMRRSMWPTRARCSLTVTARKVAWTGVIQQLVGPDEHEHRLIVRALPLAFLPRLAFGGVQDVGAISVVDALGFCHAEEKVADQAGAGFLADEPVAWDDAARASDKKTAGQRPEAFVVLLWAIVRLAGAEHRQLAPVSAARDLFWPRV